MHGTVHRVSWIAKNWSSCNDSRGTASRSEDLTQFLESACTYQVTKAAVLRIVRDII